MYHGCHMLVLGALLHLETSTLFEFCHKLVRRARYQKKKKKEEEEEEGKALSYFIQESKPLLHGQSSRLLQTCTTDALVSLLTM